MMKILIIGKHPTTGGAAIAASRLMYALRENGVEVSMLVQEGGPVKDGIYNTSGTWLKRKINFLCFVWERLIFLPRERDKSVRFLFSLANTGENISRRRLFREADIIHLHWINAGYLSLRSLKKIMRSGKPVVWTFHDMWPFTGGCHYALDCTAYTLSCGNCPYLKKPGNNDLSARVWKRKFRVLDNSKVQVITPSKWLGACVKESSLLAEWPVETIHNPLNDTQFVPMNPEVACHNLGLDPKKKYILFGAATMKNILKGFGHFLEASKQLAGLLGDTSDVEILLFGRTREDVTSMFPIPARNIAFIGSTEKLVELYSAAHVFAIPSLQDNLPNTILESMLCGTPVVGFRTGGIPEMIRHRQNGYLADYLDSEDLARGIQWVLEAEDYHALSGKTRELAMEHFSGKQAVEHHIALYERILRQDEQK